MDRRRFLLTSLAGAVAAPLVAEAQPAGKVYRIGWLPPARHPDPSEPAATTLAPIALRRLGYVEGQNLIVERRFAEEMIDRRSWLERELVKQRVDVTVAVGAAAVQAANPPGPRGPVGRTHDELRPHPAHPGAPIGR
jgi:putative tryptophan/tyrosine transport system substrate-binding protein